MLVLFLDVDGVLVHSGSLARGRASGEPGGSSFFHAATVDPDCALRLKRILDTTGAKIVVSSVWRRFDAQMIGLHRAILNAGYPNGRAVRALFAGSTPHLGEDRPAEIAAWLAAHPEVTRHVVLDDGPIPGHPQVEPRPNHFEGGLLDSHADQAIRLLMGTE